MGSDIYFGGVCYISDLLVIGLPKNRVRFQHK